MEFRNKMNVAEEIFCSVKQCLKTIFDFAFVSLIAPAIIMGLYSTELVYPIILQFCSFILVFVFVIFPVVFRCSRSLRNNFIFMNHFYFPKIEASTPEQGGLEGVRNFYITSPSHFSKKSISLGVWHILPSVYKHKVDQLTSETEKANVFEGLLQSDKPIVIYAHGNSYSRAYPSRITLYKVLQELDYHTIAFDYRGYGDSTSAKVTENAVVEDLVNVYRWTLEKTGDLGKKRPSIFVWGHSLGTGISTHALAKMASEESPSNVRDHYETPMGLILESGFSNLFDELNNHFLCRLQSMVPWFSRCIVEPVLNDGNTFESDKHIENVKSHVLILHADNDNVVPFKLGVKLYQAAKSKLLERHGERYQVHFEKFESPMLQAHLHIPYSKRLPGIVSKFVKSSIKATEANSKVGVNQKTIKSF